jgi:hypothetical protein
LEYQRFRHLNTVKLLKTPGLIGNHILLKLRHRTLISLSQHIRKGETENTKRSRTAQNDATQSDATQRDTAQSDATQRDAAQENSEDN